MGRPCLICRNPKRRTIDKALITPNDSGGFRGIARKFRVSEDALLRHKDTHLPLPLLTPVPDEPLVSPDIIENLEQLRGTLERVMRLMEEKGRYRTLVQYIRETRSCLETLAKLQTIQPPQTTVQVILQALADYPDAKTRVMDVLKELPALGHSA
jgi:hypothetical protein